MIDQRRRWLHPRFVWFVSSPWRIAALWTVLMLPLLTWGLPSDRDDDLLFGGADPWPADRYDFEQDLAALQSDQRGADVDLNPLDDRRRVVPLTPDHAARAEILRRYRLYTRQPDEQIIFRALRNMQPRAFDFDPRLYQYGGGYLYLVAATLAAGGATGLVHVTGDLGYYLENPAAFGRFYLAARLVSLVFGALALVAVHKLARRAAGRHASWLAMLFVAASPVFLTAVTEAKPHLPSACLLLWASLSALDYATNGGLRTALRLGAQVGYGFALVLTGLVGFLILPVAWFARRGRPDWTALIAATALAAIVFAALNPYLLINPDARQSNLQNSTAMYADQVQRAAEGALRVGTLLVESLGWGVLLFGLIGSYWLLRRWRRYAWIVAAPGVALLVMGVLLGAGKPAEFARFLLLPVMLLAVAAAAVLGRAWRRKPLSAMIAAALVLFLMSTPTYIEALVTDARGTHETRRLAAEYLATTVPTETTIGVLQEPAPYAVPPLDFTQRDIVKLPADLPAALDDNALPPWLVFTADSAEWHADAWWQPYYNFDRRFPPRGAELSPITWANKAVFIYQRR